MPQLHGPPTPSPPARRPPGAASRLLATAATLLLLLTPVPDASAADTPAHDARRYKVSLKRGVRGVTFSSMDVGGPDGRAMVIGSYDGYVFASDDGGQTWTENRLIVRSSTYVGAIRASPPKRSAGFLAPALFKGILGSGNLTHSLDSMFAFPYGTVGDPYLELDPESPGFWPASRPPGLYRPGVIRLSDTSPIASGGGGDARLGVGLATAAPRLKALLVRRRARVTGMNLKLLLATAGSPPHRIYHVAIRPDDPSHMLAATEMGLFRTTDGGYSWDDIFTGSNVRERRGFFATYDRNDPDVIYLGTAGGLFISRDGGQRFGRLSGTMLSSARTHWVTPHPTKPAIVYAGTNLGAFLSNDHGRTWSWIFYESLPAANNIQSIDVDPRDPDRVLLATADGLFGSSDGGTTWQRKAGLMFTGKRVVHVRVDPDDGDHILAATHRHVWESFDYGRTWRVVYIDDSDWSVRDIRFDDPSNDQEQGAISVLTSAELLQLTPRAPTSGDPAGLALFEERMAVEPTLSHALDVALKAQGAHVGERMAMRSAASLRWLVPKVSVVGGFLHVDAGAGLNAFLATDFGANPGPEPVLVRTRAVNLPYIGAMLNWDLGGLVFDSMELPMGRMWGQSEKVRGFVTREVQRLYEERRRLMLDWLTRPPGDLASRLGTRLRIDEVTGHLNILTGGAFAEAIDWLASFPPHQVPDRASAARTDHRSQLQPEEISP